MRYVILGAGAVGASLAAQLAGAGIPARLIGRGAQLDHLRREGLLYQRPDGTRRVALDVGSLDELQLTPSDLLVLAVKVQDVEALSADLARVPVQGGGFATGLPVLTLQNGLEAERIVARRFARHYAAVVRVPAIYTRTGTVSVLAEPQFASLTLGRYPAGKDDISARLTADLIAAGALVEERADIRRWKAQKLIYNVRNVVELFAATPEAAARAGDALSAEAKAVLQATGHDPATDAERRVSQEGWKITRDPDQPGGQSTWQSFTRGARSEVDFLNGEIVLLARLAGLSAPWNAAAQRLAAELAATGGAPGSIGLDRMLQLAQAEEAALL